MFSLVAFCYLKVALDNVRPSALGARCGADSIGAWVVTHLLAWSMGRCRLRECLDGGVTESQLAAFRRSNYSGGPLGSQSLIACWKKRLNDGWLRKRGPKKRTDKSTNQETFCFGA